MTDFDAIVVGLGGAGSSAAYHLSRRANRVLGIEQFGEIHSNGSSHGQSRIYRTAYSEGESYVPLSIRAQKLFHDLQDNSGEKIIQRTGGLFVGRPDSPTVRGAIRSGKSHSLDFQVLSPDEVDGRFPQFHLSKDEVALWDPEAGVLYPENCIRAHSSGAAASGATLQYNEPVTKWTAAPDSVEVVTPRGIYHARSLVLTAGPWTAGLAPDLGLPLTVERQFVLWFPPTSPGPFGLGQMPVFLWDRRPTIDTYGVPDLGEGVKIGAWSGKTTQTPETADRVLREEDARPVRDFARSSLRGLATRESHWESCLFTMAPDHNFLIGRHPRHSNVIIVSACSGHGFKFTSVVGEIVAQFVNGESPEFDLTMFDPGRFVPGSKGH